MFPSQHLCLLVVNAKQMKLRSINNLSFCGTCFLIVYVFGGRSGTMSYVLYWFSVHCDNRPFSGGTTCCGREEIE